MKKTFPFPRGPWPYFFVFLAAHTLLSYFPLDPQTKLWVVLTGLFLPLVAALAFAPSPLPPPSKEFLPSIPVWAWVLLGAAALYVRFYKLTSISDWPNYDDGLWGCFAVDFYHHWDWSLFYQDNSYPSVYFWGLGFLFKLFQPSLFLVWLYPALLSSLVVLAGVLAARRFFSRSFSFAVGLFLALGFWPMFVGRFGNQQVMTLLFECVWLFFLARFLQAPRSRKEAALLGIVTALGLYIYISWVAVALFTFLVLLAAAKKDLPRNAPALWVFLSLFLLALFPLLEAGLIKNYLRIVRDIGSLHEPLTFPARLHSALAYLSAVFWGVPKDNYSYQPVWGGLLNPILGSLFSLGLLSLLKVWRSPLSLWLLTGILFFYVPGIVTHDLEPFRILPLIPFLTVVCVIGIARLLQGLPPRKSLAYLLTVVAVSAGLDFYHLAVRYHHLWDSPRVWTGYAKPPEFHRAYGILEKIRKERGPGLIYLDFKPGLCDQTLAVAVHAFNAAENPDLVREEARWAAVLVNVNYKPFLSRRFPEGRAFSLSDGKFRPDGGEMLWVMPVTPRAKGTLDLWQAAAEAFRCFPGRYTSILRENLEKAYPFYSRDPFLESCYWEKLADLDFKLGDFKNVQKPIEDLKQGLKKGYPSAHLYQRLGTFFLMENKVQEAREALQKASTAPLDLTQASQILPSLSPRKTP
jgi:hypothetical protein